MFKIFALLILFCASVALYAEDQVQVPQDNYHQQNLLGGMITSIGGAGGPTFRGTFINNQLFFSAGGEGYAIINHSFIIGGGGYGIPLRNSFGMMMGPNFMSGIGWGGLILGYIIAPELVIHPYVKTMIGAGGIGFISNTTAMDGVAFFALEGEVGAEINVIDWVRLCPYVGYHFVAGGINILGMTDASLSGWHFGITVKFGSF